MLKPIHFRIKHGDGYLVFESDMIQQRFMDVASWQGNKMYQQVMVVPIEGPLCGFVFDYYGIMRKCTHGKRGKVDNGKGRTSFVDFESIGDLAFCRMFIDRQNYTISEILKMASVIRGYNNCSPFVQYFDWLDKADPFAIEYINKCKVDSDD